MVIWLYGYMVIWLYGYMVIWLYGYMVIWLYGYMVIWYMQIVGSKFKNWNLRDPHHIHAIRLSALRIWGSCGSSLVQVNSCNINSFPHRIRLRHYYRDNLEVHHRRSIVICIGRSIHIEIHSGNRLAILLKQNTCIKHSVTHLIRTPEFEATVPKENELHYNHVTTIVLEASTVRYDRMWCGTNVKVGYAWHISHTRTCLSNVFYRIKVDTKIRYWWLKFDRYTT